ncbi:hypothetical protein, partial [Lactococcus lactis]|uniref:hypothetical protein n=1 Tax=Lactococcus lactis TaxID=1358 RepID=UPI001D187A49
MKELTTIDNLDVTQLSKEKLLDYFALTISQEQPAITTRNIVNQNWGYMTKNSKSPKDKELKAMFNILPDKSLEELITIRDTFIKKDTEKLNEINKEIQQYQENIKTQEAEYSEQRRNLTVDSLTKHLNFKNKSEFEKVFVGKKNMKTSFWISITLAIALAIFLYIFPENGILYIGKSRVSKFGPLDINYNRIFLYSFISLFVWPILFKIGKIVLWKLKLSKGNNIQEFIQQIPLDLAKVNYSIKNGKPSYISSFNGNNYDYPSSLNYSVTLNVEEYKNNLERAKILKEHISIWKDKGEDFLVSVKNLTSEYNKISMLQQSNTRLGKALPGQWNQNTSEGMVETSLIFSNLISSGRADTWKEAANL